MNIEKELKESVKRLLKKSAQTPIYELECIIGNINRDINKRDDMINILKRIKGKSRFSRMTTNNSLLISFPRENNIYNSITKNISRVVINGNGLISNYIKTNRLNSMIDKVIFENKSYDNIENDRLLDDNFNLRFNLKKEEKIDINSSSVINLVREWKNIDKYFRKKSTYTFYEEENDFKIDISIISSSKKFSYSKTLQESKVLDNKYISYEFEIEYIGNKKPDIKDKMLFSISKSKSKSKRSSKKHLETKKEVDEYQNYVVDKYQDIIKILLRAKQQSLFVIGTNDKVRINNSFRKLVGNDDDTYLPNVVDLEPSNVLQLPIFNYFTNDYDKNIRMDYAVTDKADGTRYILFIDKDGKCYFKGRDSDNSELNSYKYTGTVIKEYANSIFDGELIDKTMDGKFIQNYYIFDAYIIKGNNITSFPFGQKGDTKSRYNHVIQFEKYFENSDGVLQEDDIPLTYLLKIFKKNYYYGNMSNKVKSKIKDIDMNDPKAIKKIVNKYDTKIFESIEKILKKCNKKYGGLLEEGHMFSYPLDGLIFQPVLLGVNQDNEGQNKNKIGGTWRSAFRWKPPHELTIDFMVKFNKVGTTNFQQEFFYKNKKYIQGTLFCKMWKTNYHKQMMAYKLINNSENFSQYEEDYAFSPLYPYNGKMDSDGRLYDATNQIYLLVDGNGKVRCQNGEFINDGDTIECGYDLSKEEKFRWTPMKIRANKTPNSYMTALGAWKLINNPITVDTILGNKTIENTYYYYNKQTSNETSAMRKFNNFVKREIIHRGITATTNKTKKKSLSPKSKYNISGKSVLDLACGKMGDFLKYCLNGADKLVGIDISPDNIFNIENGAATRILKTYSKDPQFKKLISQTLMILGDCSKSLSNSDAALDDLNKYYLDIIYGKIKPKKGKLARMSGIAINGFDLVVCNFAIHYMFNSQETLDTFLQNVQENLAKGGYFVGSCLDGDAVASALGKKQIIEGYYTGNNNDKSEKTDSDSSKSKKSKSRKSKQTIDNTKNKLIWSIKKVDADQVFFENNYVNQKVSVYMDTFFDAFEENLVNMDYLIEQCSKFGLEIVDTKLFIDTQDNLFNEFKNKNKEEYKKINSNEAIKEWLSFQRWFIFQKVKK